MLHKVIGWKTSFDGNQPHVAYVKGLYQFTCSEKSDKKSERQEERRFEAHQTVMNRTERKLHLSTLGIQFLLFIANDWMATRSL